MDALHLGPKNKPTRKQIQNVSDRVYQLKSSVEGRLDESLGFWGNAALGEDGNEEGGGFCQDAIAALNRGRRPSWV